MGGSALIGGVIGGLLGIPGASAGIAGGALLGGAIGAEGGYLASTFLNLDTAARGFEHRWTATSASDCSKAWSHVGRSIRRRWRSLLVS